MKYHVRLRSMNPSAESLRTQLRAVKSDRPFIVRLGSRTPIEEILPKSHQKAIEFNSIESIENSRNKLRMKSCFATEGVSQSDWFVVDTTQEGDHVFKSNLSDKLLAGSELPYPVVVKRVCGFKGKGMRLVHSQEELGDIPANSYIERFRNFSKEYRIHATQNETFLSWRKLRKDDATERWFFNSTNCNWVGEDHQLFDKPTAWELMCQHAMKAIKATGLTIGAVDVRCKADAKNEKDFIVLEVNSAPELGEIATNKYFEVISNHVKNYDDI